MAEPQNWLENPLPSVPSGPSKMDASGVKSNPIPQSEIDKLFKMKWNGGLNKTSDYSMPDKLSNLLKKK